MNQGMRSSRCAVRVLTAAAVLAGLTLATAPAFAATSPDAVAPRVIATSCGHRIYSLTTIPAAGFNPLTATPAQLSANNFPARPSPSHPVALAQWKRFVARAGATRSTCAGLRLTHQTSGGLRRPGAVSRPDAVTGTSPTQNWSGYVVNSHNYSDAEAEWTLPYANGVTGTSDYSCAWVGIGLGDSSSFPLMQAGTESDYLGGTLQYYLWYEVYPDTAKVHTDAAVEPGDNVGVHVTYTTSGPEFHLWDTTRNFNQDLKVSGSWDNDGHAEWIYERTTFDGVINYLADAPPSFTEAQAVITGGGWTPLGDLPATAIDMYNCPETQELAYPGAISSSGYNFTEHYLHHGDDTCKAP
jgi:Peptidase A4 family